MALHLYFGFRSDVHGSVNTDREGHVAIRPVPNQLSGAPSLAAERRKSTISLGEQGKPAITHIHTHPADGRPRLVVSGETTDTSSNVEDRDAAYDLGCRRH